MKYERSQNEIDDIGRNGVLPLRNLVALLPRSLFGGKACECVRVGFVCEALIQFLPIIGWYRKIVARDIFVWRSFKQDAPTIQRNIQDFIVVREKRMLFLSPEGVVVDFGPKDRSIVIISKVAKLF